MFNLLVHVCKVVFQWSICNYAGSGQLYMGDLTSVSNLSHVPVAHAT